ncbi:MAG TPA: glycosyltransferase [Thermoleophilia bacterium]|nr:glycosyltransferase [Thermoleophilia bacterium]
MTSLLHVINLVMLGYFLILDFIYAGLLALSYLECARHNRRIIFGGYDVIFRSPLTLPVSVLMPAYNEAATIVETVNALRLLEYGQFEIVVIDDGSSDGTLTQLERAFSLERVDRPLRLSIPCQPVTAILRSRDVPNLTVLRKENGGKSDALNAGINAARYPLFCAIDADAILERDALLRVVKPFMERPRETVASAGIVRVANGCRISTGRVVEVGTPANPLALLQVVEYLRAFLGNRMGWSKLRALFIISGAFGVFKKAAVIDVGGYRTDTVGEDMDLVMRLHRLMRQRREAYRIVFIPDPVVWTEVPESFKTLHRQRNRWHRGLLECLTRNPGMTANPRFGSVGLLAMPYNLVFEAAGPFVETTGYVALVVTAALGLLSPRYFLLFFLLAVAYGVFLSVSCVLLEEVHLNRYRRPIDVFRLLLFAVLENFGYRQLQTIWRVEATIDFLRKKSSWGDMPRKGFETSSPQRCGPALDA